ncbi:MAG TPA: peroxidase family protein [Methylomirabilota bacterium]|nr:peroxidase family protein [Methylomirabilota bacterium]
MALRIRIPFVLDLAIVRDDAEMTRLNNDRDISREVSGTGGIFHRLIRKRIESLRVDAARRLPTFEPRANQAREAAQKAAEARLTALASTAQPFDRHAVATLARYVAGHDPAVPVGVTVQHLVGRMLDPAYVATAESYRAARDVAAVFSACPFRALRVLWWRLTGRLAASKQRIWDLAQNDPVVIHATALAMHQLVESLARMRKAMRTDGPWDTTPAEAAAWALSAPPRLVRECVMKTKGATRFRRGTLVFFRLGKIHKDTESNDLGFSRKQWSECPAHAIVPRLLADVWAAAVRERSAQRYKPRPSLARRLLLRPVMAGVGWLNRRVPWYRLPGWPLQFVNLWVLREVLRERNLHDTSLLPSQGGGPLPQPTPDVLRWRSADGSFNSLEDPTMGQAGTRFGRNVPLGYAHPEDGRTLLEPNPRLVSRELLTRKTFIPAGSLNGLAAAWIQFQVHDWFHHGDPDHGRPFEIPLEESDPWPKSQRPMRVGRTRPDPTRSDDPPVGPPTYINSVTHWWDASQLYGSDLATQRALRTWPDGTRRGGRLALSNGRLRRGENGIEITGFNANWWLGLSLFHQLFTLEHNAICGRLRAEYPGWDDEQLFQTARLINAALIAKIHDLEWVPTVLANKAVQKGLYSTWWGLLGKRIATTFGRLGSELLSGIPSSPTDHHNAPFAITEEFVSVYRMHAFMMPDELAVFDAATGGWLYTLPLPTILGPGAGTVVDKYGFANLFYSFGRNVPGALTLGNYAGVFQSLQPVPGDDRLVDLATVDILRDRERGVPRYNMLRQLLQLPPIRSFEELNPAWAPKLREVYRTVDRIDLMVGLLAETPPPGFGFSDTTFRVFLLMNSRRRKSDRFYTTDYTAAVYTQVGLDWIADNDLPRVLLRHYPALEGALRGVPNVFGPWPAPAKPTSAA